DLDLDLALPPRAPLPLAAPAGRLDHLPLSAAGAAGLHAHHLAEHGALHKPLLAGAAAVRAGARVRARLRARGVAALAGVEGRDLDRPARAVHQVPEREGNAHAQ